MIAGNDRMMQRADRNNDEVYTPFCAVELILEFLPKNKIIWCPFDEKWSAFYQLLSERGYTVERSSLKEGQDFFEYEPEKWDILVSNPPYSRKDDVLERAFYFGKPFALLLPIAAIQGQKRHSIFMNEIQMLVPDSRINYHSGLGPSDMQKNCYFGTAYFCRDLLPTKLECRKLKKYERSLL